MEDELLRQLSATSKKWKEKYENYIRKDNLYTLRSKLINEIVCMMNAMINKNIDDDKCTTNSTTISFVKVLKDLKLYKDRGYFNDKVNIIQYPNNYDGINFKAHEIVNAIRRLLIDTKVYNNVSVTIDAYQNTTTEDIEIVTRYTTFVLLF